MTSCHVASRGASGPEGERALLAYEKPGRIGPAVLSAVPGNPLFVDASRQAQQTVALGASSADATGPYLLTLLAHDPDVTILQQDAFYPDGWDEPERRDDAFPGSYAVHHWAGGFMPPARAPR